MIKHWESTLNWPPSCPRNGVHLCPVARGDEVVLIGTQRGPGGVEHIRAEEWADAL